MDVEQLEKVLPQLVGGWGSFPGSRAWPGLAPVRLNPFVPHSFWTSRCFYPHSCLLPACVTAQPRVHVSAVASGFRQGRGC